MKPIIFFEKPGCITNAKQKKLLANMGLDFQVADLLTHPWQPETLIRFLLGKPVEQWFNPSAPAIKAGDVKPDQLTQYEALHALIADPILIRRPLLQIGDHYQSGFDIEKIAEQVGLPVEADVVDSDLNIDSCSKPGVAVGCP